MRYTSSDEAPKSFHLPAGDYVVTIVDATETVSRSTGADMIKLVLDAEAADGSTTTLFDYLVASPSSAWKIDAFRRALGHTVVQGEAVELAAEDLIGSSLRARLRVEEFNGRLSNKIEAWLAPLAEGEPRKIAATAKSAKEDDANEPF